MRLVLSILTAILLHGLALGAAAAVVEPRPVASLNPAIAEVDLIPAQPIAELDSRPSPPPTSTNAPANQTPTPSARGNPPEKRMAPANDIVASNDAEQPQPVATENSTAATEPTAAVGVPTPPLPATSGFAPASTAPKPTPPATSRGTVASAKPHYRSNPKPKYPIPSRRRREEGVVYLSVSVRSDGVPASISLGRSSGYPLLDRAALDAVARWTFEPARAAGVAVSSMVSIPIRFSLSENQ